MLLVARDILIHFIYTNRANDSNVACAALSAFGGFGKERRREREREHVRESNHVVSFGLHTQREQHYIIMTCRFVCMYISIHCIAHMF